MAGMVVRSDILEDKDGKSRGMGTVTFDMPLEAVQAVCILLQRAVLFECLWDVHVAVWFHFVTIFKLFRRLFP